MIEFIISIPGKYFLLFFIFYVFLVIITARIYKYIRDISSGNKRLPKASELNYLEMAYLKKGRKGALSTAIFNLWNRKVINISKKNKTVTVNKKSTKKGNLNLLEDLIYSYAQRNTPHTKFYIDPYVTEKIDEALKPNISNLQRLNLIYNKSRNKENKIILFISFILVYALSTIKLYFGIVRDKPVLFLILLMIAVGFALYYFLKPKPITPLGKDFLNLANIQFEHFKQARHDSTIMEDNSIIYAIALFGVSPFLMDSTLQETFRNTQMYDSASSGSSAGGGDGGGGCSGCSSGCGGGGCGGCGGCG